MTTFNTTGLKPIDLPEEYTANQGKIDPTTGFDISGLKPIEPVQAAPAPVPDNSEYLNRLMAMENAPLAAQKDDYIVKPNIAPEANGGSDIGFGHKLTPKEVASGKVNGIDYKNGITKAQSAEVFNADVAKHTTLAKDIVGSDNFDALPIQAQNILTDFSYNGALSKFPKFTKALMERDLEGAEKEYKRYYSTSRGRRELLTRNEFTKSQLDSLKEEGYFGDIKSPKPGALETALSDIVSGAADTVAGVGQGALGLVASAVGFGVAAPQAVGDFVTGIAAGHPMVGMSEAGKTMERIMAKMQPKVTTNFGKTVMTVAASPFTVGYDIADKTVKEVMYLNSKTPEELQALVEDRSADGKGTKEAWLKANSGKVEKVINATHFVLDIASAIVPELARGKKIPVKDYSMPMSQEVIADPNYKAPKEEKVAKVKKPKVAKTSKKTPLKPEEVPEVVEAIKTVLTEEKVDVPTESLDTVIAQINKVAQENVEKDVGTATVPSNQHIVDALIAAANERSGVKKKRYADSAKIVAGWRVDAANADLTTITKKPGKVTALIEQLVKDRKEEVKAPEVPEAPVEPVVEAITETTEVPEVTNTPVLEIPPEPLVETAPEVVTEPVKPAEPIVDPIVEVKPDPVETPTVQESAPTKPVKKDPVTLYGNFDADTSGASFIMHDDTLPANIYGRDTHSITVDKTELFDATDPVQAQALYDKLSELPEYANENSIADLVNFWGIFVKKPEVLKALNELGYKGYTVKIPGETTTYLLREYAKEGKVDIPAKVADKIQTKRKKDATKVADDTVEAVRDTAEKDVADIKSDIKMADKNTDNIAVGKRLRKVDTVGAALDIARESIDDPITLKIIDRIYDFVRDISFELVDSYNNSRAVPGLNVGNLKRGAKGVTQTDIGTGLSRVLIASDELYDMGTDLNTVVIHEAIHAAADLAMHKAKSAKVGTVLHKVYKDLEEIQIKLMEKAIADASTGHYDSNTKSALYQAGTDIHELMTYGLTDPIVKELLKKIVMKNGETLYSKFVNAIRKLLGIGDAESTAFSKLIEALDTVVEPAKVPKIDPAVAKAERLQALKDTYSDFKNRSIEKINAAKSTVDGAPDVPITPADVAPFDTDHMTFKDRASAEKYLEDNEIVREIIEDPLTGEVYFEPDIGLIDDLDLSTAGEDIWSEDFDYGSRPESFDEFDDGWSDLNDGDPTIMKFMVDANRKGVDIGDTSDPFRITQLKIFSEKMKNIQSTAKKMGMDVRQLLDTIGTGPEMTAKILDGLARLEDIKTVLHEVDPIIDGMLNPDPATIHSHRTVKGSKGKKKYIPTTEAEATTIWSARRVKWGESWLGNAMKATEIPVYAFERFGKGMKEMLWEPFLAKKNDAKIEKDRLSKEVQDIAKSFTKEERKEIAIVGFSRSKGGINALAADGITEIPKLSARQEAGLKNILDRYEDLWNRINYVRVKIGLDPVKKLDNYLPFIHKQNELRKQGIGLSDVAMSAKMVKNAHKKFNGTFFPFEKKRLIKTDRALDLDIFAAYDKYISYAMDEIHIAPIAAKAKELVFTEMKVKGKGKMKLLDANEDLSNFLLKWADDILGIDPATNIHNAYLPAVSKMFSRAHKNLVAAMIFGNVGTVLKQPTALKGAIGSTSFRDVVHGTARLAIEKPFRRGLSEAARKSKVLAIRSADLILSEMAKDIATGKISGVMKTLNNITSAPMNFVDMLTAEASWNAGYSYGKRALKLSEIDAIKYADDVVVKTNGLGIRGTASPIQSVGSIKWLTMLQTYVITDFNYLARDVIGYKNPDMTKATQVKHVLRYITAGTITNMLYQLAGMDAPNPSPIQTYSDEIKDGSSQQIAILKAMLEFVEVIPLVGGSVKYNSSLLGPVGELAKDVPAAMNDLIKAADWDGMTDKQKLNFKLTMGKVIGASLGIPMTNQIVKSIRTSSNGGNVYETILGIYMKPEKKSGPFSGSTKNSPFSRSTKTNPFSNSEEPF